MVRGVRRESDEWVPLWDGVKCFLLPSEIIYDEVKGDKSSQSVLKFCCQESCSYFHHGYLISRIASALGWQKAPSVLWLVLSLSGVGNSVAYNVLSSQSSNDGVCRLYTAGARRKYVS